MTHAKVAHGTGYVSGTIVEWTGPAECVIMHSSGRRIRGLLLEAHKRRETNRRHPFRRLETTK